MVSLLIASLLEVCSLMTIPEVQEIIVISAKNKLNLCAISFYFGLKPGVIDGYRLALRPRTEVRGVIDNLYNPVALSYLNLQVEAKNNQYLSGL
jgi:hypothetical protein